jgi:SAM-dependent methyltransferase
MDEKIELKLVESVAQEHDMIESIIKNKASKNEPIHILEAGCGRRWPFRLEGIQYVLTGVDMDKEALEARKNTLSDLHETIEGNLCSVDLGTDRFDVIYSSYVLEHIKNADKVLENFARWVKPNGIIIIRIPDPCSVYGFFARITPHWFHVLYYRFMGDKNAGKPGYAPYPTYYHPIVSRSGIHKFCHNHDNGMVLDSEYGIDFKPGQGVKKTLIQIIKKATNVISFGALSNRHTNLLYVIRKIF